jgi:PEP-CTERM motif
MRLDSVLRFWGLFLAAIAAPLSVAAPATAAVTVVEGSGTVTGVFGGNPMGPAPVATGTVQTGDTLNFRFVFDTAATNVLFNGGVGFQVLALPVTSASVRVGGYDFQPDFSSANPPVLLLGTGFQLFPPNLVSEPIFSQQFVFAGLPGGNPPFVIGPGGGATFSLSSLFRFDLGGRVPTAADLRDPALAMFRSFSIGFNDGTGGLGNVQGNFTATITSAAVPEPATWAMLILGFGVIGGAMRAGKARRGTMRFNSPLA